MAKRNYAYFDLNTNNMTITNLMFDDNTNWMDEDKLHSFEAMCEGIRVAMGTDEYDEYEIFYLKQEIAPGITRYFAPLYADNGQTIVSRDISPLDEERVKLQKGLAFHHNIQQLKKNN